MKIQIELKNKNADLSTFEPAEGSWDLNLPSFSTDADSSEIEEVIASELSEKYGFAVTVDIFKSNGHAIIDDTPTAGSFLATRK